jgi:prepilin-type N-terminal cleavage/methylation domain-containing protein
MEADKRNRELGFTLLELLVAMIIIGTLAAIAIPMFRQHAKTAVEATLVSDVREAAYQMEQDSIMSSNGDYPATISEDFHHSENNNVILVENDYSDISGFCLIGRNSDYTDLYVYYDSTDRTVTTTHAQTGDCGTGETYPPGTQAGAEPPLSPTASPEAAPPAPVGYSDSKRKKYNVCHGTGMLTLPLPAFAHQGHDIHPDDIIPPIPNGYPKGKNWTQAGAKTWYNNCVGGY